MSEPAVKPWLAAALLLACTPASAQDAGDNAEIAALFAADQAARSGTGDVRNMFAEDAQRRRRAREMLEQGALTTAADFYAAAFIFQHGTVPENYLLAHVLAIRSLALGKKEAEWIAAASLDRYLQNTGKSQIYGTQYRRTPETGTTMEPYDKALLTDALREASGVGTVAQQEARISEMDALLKSLPAPPSNP